MMRQSFAIELLEDCVFSASAATEGGHESLDRIPGAALLGVAAARLYNSLGSGEAFTVFHSGKLRFNDGLPLRDGSIGFPVPLSWHHRKTDKVHQNGHVLSGAIYNLQFGAIPQGNDGRPPQPKQLRKGYIHLTGAYTIPNRELRLKTSINPKTGRAAEGQLFGYDALLRGQHFATSIEADPDFDRSLFQRVVEALSGVSFLGRSRSAEYGKAMVKPVETPTVEYGPASGNNLVLWLLSDLALIDQAGQPNLNLTHVCLGMPANAHIVWDKTFLRYRRYSPWNAARHGYDQERLVFNAGGVITLNLPEPPSQDMLTALQSGIGGHREAGLGRVWVNPALLAVPQPAFREQPKISSPVSAPPVHPLLVWLEGQDRDLETQAEESALAIAKDFREALNKARYAAGVPKEASDFGPSKSQWGAVLEAARNYSGQELYEKIFNASDAIIKIEMPGWNVEIPMRPGEWMKLADWMNGALNCDRYSSRSYAYLVRQLAHRLRADTEKQRRSA
jgi:CRISPR-associated protein (Cas_Cmr3).